MNYGLLTYAENKRNFNVGDYIQSIAARQFLPRVDSYINREKLADFKGEKTKIILNGWFTHKPENWIPSPDLDPLFISFHINSSAAPFMLTQSGLEYLKQKEPIGCRDLYTVTILKEKGINAYFSGCLTLTLDSYKVKDEERSEEIIIVDPLYGYPSVDGIFYDYKRFVRSIQNLKIFQLGKRNKHLNKIIAKELLHNAVYVNQVLPAHTYTDEQKFKIAEEILKKYARAKLIITSRIHCALPCLSLGTPVIYLNGFESFVDSCRLDGILDLFNRIDINTKTGVFQANFPLDGKIGSGLNIKNPERHIELVQSLKRRCSSFLKSQVS